MGKYKETALPTITHEILRDGKNYQKQIDDLYRRLWMLEAGTVADRYYKRSLGTNNADVIKSSAGEVSGWYVYNNASSVRFVKLYNKATTPNPASDTIGWVIAVPAGSAANAFPDDALYFDTGIAIAMVTGSTDTDNTAVTAGDLLVSIAYT